MGYKSGLSDKQQAFVRNYIKTFNATQSAINAGYSEKGASQQGSTLLANPKVAAELTRLTKMIQTKAQISAERVLNELKLIAFSDLRNYVEWDERGVTLVNSSELKTAHSRALKEVTETITMHGGTKSIKMHDKIKALELIGRHLKMFVDRVEHTGKDGGPIEVDAPLSEKELEELANLRKKLKGSE